LWRQEGAFWAAIASLQGLLWLAGPGVTGALRFDRSALAAGEWWRALTGNLVHASGRHLLLNLAGLALVALLFPGEYSRGRWSLIALASALVIAVGLYWFSPEVAWYVGMSGVLHGLLAAGAIAWWRGRFRGMAALLAGILVVKLVAEQSFGPMGWSGDLKVIVDAHLYGAAGGAIAGLLLTQLRRAGSPTLPSGPSGPV